MDATGQQDAAVAGKYLAFRLSMEEYGIRILDVREIIPMTDVTPLPGMPHSVKGVVNLKGRIVPVIDLRATFGMGEIRPGPETCIIVVDTGTELSGSRDGGAPQPAATARTWIGCIVDTVSEVVTVAPDQVEAVPAGASIRADCMLGLGKLGGRVVVLLDIARVTGSVAIAAVDEAQRAGR